MANGAYIQARIDPNIKAQARSVLNQLGLSMSQAISVYMAEIVLHRGIPFELKIPNDITIETFEKTDAGEDLHRVSSLSELKAELKV